MPDTRALFEELVRDKPALHLDVAAIERRAEATIRRRRALAGVVVLAAAGSVAVSVAGRHAPRPEPAAPSAPSGLAFTSAEQITSADTRVADAMLATAGTGSKITLSNPATITATTRRTIHEVSYQRNGATVTLLENVSAPDGNAELGNLGITGKDRNAPCATPHHAPATQADGTVVTYATSILCVGRSLPDGATLWTFVTHWGDSALDSSPQAVIEEPDGSSVLVQTSAVKAGQDAPGTMTRDQVGAFSIALDKAWQG